MSTLVKAAIVIVACVLAAFGCYWLFDKLVDRPVGSDSVLADKAPAIGKQPVTEITIAAPVKAYTGNTKRNLKLPAAVQADPKQQVIAASQVKADLRPQTVSTVINTETGKVETYVKTDPYPWFAWEPRGEARVAYGYKFDARQHTAKPVARLQVGYDAIRVKALTVGVLATLDSDRDAFVGVGVAYRW